MSNSRIRMEATLNPAEAAAEIIRLRGALYRCAEASGADTSGGVPTSLWIGDWAVQCVEELRRDYDTSPLEEPTSSSICRSGPFGI